MGRNEVILLGGQLRQSISRVYQINIRLDSLKAVIYLK